MAAFMWWGMSSKIIPIILAGGVGARLWPLSREASPKQFLRLVSQYSLLQETVLRTKLLSDIQCTVIVCNADHYAMSHQHLKEINADGCQFILEPFGKNTAPAIACAAESIASRTESESILLVLPSDHYIADPELFIDAVRRAKEVAEKGFLVTFGVVPTGPETGYGYIQAGDPLAAETYYVKKFIEKPPLELAKQFLGKASFYWNSGMFMFKPKVYLEELKKASPDIYDAAVESVLTGEKKEDYIRLNSETFARCPNISIDYAVMEKTHKAVVIPLAASWNDLGCWAAVAKSGICDANSNVVKGDVLIQDSENCFVSAEGQMVAILGLKNQIVVATPDVVLVANKACSQNVKNLVQQLKSNDSHLVTHHKKQHHASGYTENLATSDWCAIDHMTLNPGSQLSVPACAYPAYWVVVNGTAEILVEEHTYKISANHSLSIEQALKCDLINKTEQALHLVRIQLKTKVTAQAPNKNIYEVIR